MDYKKVKTNSSAITRRMKDFDRDTMNVYETINIMAKRSNQIGIEIKEELNRKLAEFASPTDNLEEVFENREQIEIARFYERLPKPTLISVQEWLDDEIYHRNPSKETTEK